MKVRNTQMEVSRMSDCDFTNDGAILVRLVDMIGIVDADRTWIETLEVT